MKYNINQKNILHFRCIKNYWYYIY